MDSVELEYNEESVEDTSAEHVLSLSYPCMSGMYGEPQVLPRVGDQYQVEIPTLAAQLDGRNCQIADDIKSLYSADYNQLMLPVPVMWVRDVFDHVKYSSMQFQRGEVDASNTDNVECKSEKESQMNSESNLASHFSPESSNSHVKIPDGSMLNSELPENVDSDNGKEFGGAEYCDHTVVGDQMDVDFSMPQHKKSNFENRHEGKDYYPVPGSLGSSWSDIEKESFLLGLYIFGKNLVQVKRFVESKGMGDIQSFYYGQFYRSNGHHRWSECRKMRSRRSIHGQRIFTGWRQQELLSRLLPCVSADCGNALVEVSKIFGEGKISLEDYVSSLKGMVGPEVLVEAIGVGKGRKNDLTGIVMEPMKANQVISLRSEIPIGKACSSLTSGDIIKFLTGDFRLSKARSNDLFWEAVWPRLLARGWHSEQPMNQGFAGSKHHLVFLIPGIKKFSRRKLVKGDHYFDSISDVLNKVASDPNLLELEVDAADGSGTKVEYGWDQNTTLDKPDHQRHCYLRPRLPNRNSEVAKFTIVDTSLLHGEAGCQVRELRSLPVDITRGLSERGTHAFAPASSSSESDSESYSEEQVNEQESAVLLLNDKQSHPTMADGNKLLDGLNCMPRNKVHADVSSSKLTVLSKGMPINDPDSLDMMISNHEDPFPTPWNGDHCKVRAKRRCGARMRSDRRNCFRGRLKLPRLDVCNQAEINQLSKVSSACLRLKEEELCGGQYSLEPRNIMVTDVGQEKSIPDERNECAPRMNCFAADTICAAVLSHEKQPPRTLIDLNLPHVAPDFETVEPFISEVADSRDGSIANGLLFGSESSQQPDFSHALETSNGMAIRDLPSANARRQSTRNRPLTTKVLEAFECGFFSTRRRGRGTKALPQGSLMRRSSRRRAFDVATSSVNVGTDDSRAEGIDEECTSDTNMDVESQIWSEREGTQNLVRIPKTAYHPEISTGKDVGWSGDAFSGYILYGSWTSEELDHLKVTGHPGPFYEQEVLVAHGCISDGYAK
ncbi:hypothetical protein ACLOJK_026114 [Asimina triloba]